jgi:hypothetical protein
MKGRQHLESGTFSISFNSASGFSATRYGYSTYNTSNNKYFSSPSLTTKRTTKSALFHAFSLRAEGLRILCIASPRTVWVVMMVTGAAGGLVDPAFGWNKACLPQVEAWKRYQQQSELEKEAERRKS